MGYIHQEAATAPESSTISISMWVYIPGATFDAFGLVPILVFGEDYEADNTNDDHLSTLFSSIRLATGATGNVQIQLSGKHKTWTSAFCNTGLSVNQQFEVYYSLFHAVDGGIIKPD